MAETTCPTQPFSYSVGAQHQVEVRDPLHELNQSISFGRFDVESLSWEKWSAFPHRKYVEEAEKFSRPGSVAQMKAFFDAHYKNVAAKKAAEAASTAEIAKEVNKITNQEQENETEVSGNHPSESVVTQSTTEEKSDSQFSDEKLMEKPLLKERDSSRKEKSKATVVALASLTPLPSLCNKTPVPIKNQPDMKRGTPFSSRGTVNPAPVKEINRNNSTIIRKLDGFRVHSNSNVPQSCTTPLKTINVKNIQVFVTPQSTIIRDNSTDLYSSATGTKKPRPRWNLLPTDCSKFLSNRGKKTIASPFTFRTEERATRRKEKLEEKFISEGTKKVNIQPNLKEKAEAEFKKLCRNFCFKARPLPDFYKERPRKKL